ncbi:MAG: hypothetical protein A2418_01525 [Candidatus Brennerbacteria bacterium RIFOXYC1_FULL_41_11]|uniref:Metallopeptidase domain-containing protein n=1 Tax=Candidatus Brennerbacteria bacterium RIFOXYD1_FULL_41_16 TaxID=1797529 RepID=A0A1G1XIX7_9BACT|nr:MAG: hypothetical protein A2418_01525 [Candidatus Brennerbacteria bacterium RIFOXYC1_FULL_41_11]OGY39361.1 MAG: hypothetical protein A2391_02715 [Candidatus Brennerbacteria bacterium RIFOXYB1_FULL_41_13]OGY39989.1 MAG: hypothetical protein A2570_00665 [Candidatus Brennerbacteria bacterium RIFOXYD1_FULL_41_16]
MTIDTKEEKLRRKLNVSLDFIKKTRFVNLIKNINKIKVFDKNGYDTDVNVKTRVWYVQPKTIKYSSVEYLSSLFIHEAWHVEQEKKGLNPNGRTRTERGAYLKQRLFLELYGEQYEVDWLDKEYKRKWWLDKKRVLPKFKTLSG